jgi:hypothetical protein
LEKVGSNDTNKHNYFYYIIHNIPLPSILNWCFAQNIGNDASLCIIVQAHMATQHAKFSLHTTHKYTTNTLKKKKTYLF